MKYIIFTFDGGGFPIAKHLQDEGHEVIVGQVEERKATLTRAEKRSNGEEGVLEKKRRLALYKNLVERVPADLLIKRMGRIKNPKEFFVLFDFNNLFRYADQVRDMGFNGHFPTEQDRLFEVDRDAAKEFIKKYYPNIVITEKHEFRSIRRAKKFLRETKDVWVLKGKAQSAPTFVPEVNDPELARWQIIETLEAFSDSYEEAGFVLDKKIASPIEITPEKIYYDGVPICMSLNFENKPIGSGNLSLQTGCATDLVFPISMQNRIHDIAFPPIVDKLAKRHKGLFFWDASLLFDKTTGTIHFGEFCPNRPWYNSFFTYLSQMPSTNHFFESVVAQKNPFTLGTVGASVTLFNLHRDPTERYLLSGASVNYTQESAKNIWPYDVYKKTKNDKMRIVGYGWELSPITGAGRSIDEAVRNVYKNVDNFSLAGAYYRPKYDMLSMDYPTSILNRLRYGLRRKLYDLPFQVNF
jgi:hypothetical protein